MPVIMLSARAGEEARVEGLDAGADDYLVKPFSARELIARVTGLLTRPARACSSKSGARACRGARSRPSAASRAKDEFLAMLGHELRNPLAPILTALQLMRLRGRPRSARAGRHRAPGRAPVAARRRSARRLAHHARQGRAQYASRSSWRDVVPSAIEMASPLLEQRQHHVDVSTCRAADWRVEGRPRPAGAGGREPAHQRGEVHASPEAASPSRAEREDGDGGSSACATTASASPPRCCTGSSSLFVQQPQTLDRAHGGLGLGLAIVRSLVQLHGGTVHVAAATGSARGSEFIVRLPPVDVPAARDASMRPRRRQPCRASIRVRACSSSTTIRTRPTC